MKRKLEYLFIHCTATEGTRYVSKEDIELWHKAPKPQGNGWKQVGYSDLICICGGLVNLVGYNKNEYVEGWEITNGVRGKNGVSRHIVYAGGLIDGEPHNTLNKAQEDTLVRYIQDTLEYAPNIVVLGHCDVDNKKPHCPGFDVREFMLERGFKEKNTFKG
jgi:hypothetical protein